MWTWAVCSNWNPPLEALNLSLEILDPFIRRISVNRDLMRVVLAASAKQDRTFMFLQCTKRLNPGADDACFALLRTPVVGFTLHPCGPMWAIACFFSSLCPSPALPWILNVPRTLHCIPKLDETREMRFILCHIQPAVGFKSPAEFVDLDFPKYPLSKICDQHIIHCVLAERPRVGHKTILQKHSDVQKKKKNHEKKLCFDGLPKSLV